MKRYQFIFAGWLAVIVLLSSPAQAQPFQAFASPSGSGGACSASSPCDLGNAIASVESSSGIVSCVDGGSLVNPGYITPDSFTIDCPGAVVSSNSGVFLN